MHEHNAPNTVYLMLRGKRAAPQCDSTDEPEPSHTGLPSGRCAVDPCLTLHTPQKSVGHRRKETDADEHQPPGGRDDHDALRTFEHFGNRLGHTFWSWQGARDSRGERGADVA